MFDANSNDETEIVQADSIAKVESAPAEHPRRIGRYRIERVLGKGGFGLVYLAHDEQLDRPVALKVPHAELIRQPKDAEAYLTEARTVANLDHSHIVPVYDVGSTENSPCYVISKYVEGTDLATRLKQQRLNYWESTGLVVTVAEALHYAHKQGLVHRDVKPGNILIGKDGKAYVVDFGLALREENKGKGPVFAGTPAYMSPEQARGEGHRVDGRSDIYSLGVVLYELLTDRRPFSSTGTAELLEQIAFQEPKPLRQIDDAVPKELDRICLKALSNRARERYATALDMAEDLRHFLEQQPVNSNSSTAPAALVPSRHAGSTMAPGDSDTRQSDSDSEPIKVVPKGLRSFDEHDADFFLELLPGPRDRVGLPDSIRFWKRRIEETDADKTFSVGLIYGPSGCGKSSLVRAGLLPRLAEDVIAVYIESTPDETETRLLHGLRKRFPALDNLNLKDMLAALRRDEGLAEGKKVLIVLDQFEQWLHAKKEGENSGLVQALRQCDGTRVQCIVMVRDDFWLAVSRFLRELEVRLLEGDNSALADLFDVDHAKKVLADFGQAFGKLPKTKETSLEQTKFLEDAAIGLSEDGKVICVRLALFAEMMKGKSWTPATLNAVGGAKGVGFTFLEETFSASTAPPAHRHHQNAARAVLKALLPVSGTDIKGQMKSYDQLLDASGYQRRPEDFDHLVRLLDRGIRLITPTDPEGVQSNDGHISDVEAGGRYYQLTHDYLVHALRDWLTRKQKETRRGRAELRLAERSTAWKTKRENRYLPSWWEFLYILILTSRNRWSKSEKLMMRQGGWVHGRRFTGLVLTTSAVIVALLSLMSELTTTKNLTDVRLAQTHFESAIGKAGGERLAHLGAAIGATDDVNLTTLSQNVLAFSWNTPLSLTLPEFRRVCLSTDGTRALVYGRGDARVWDTKAGKLVGKPLEYDSIVCAAHYGPKGPYFLACKNDQQRRGPVELRIWDVTRREPVGEPLQHDDSVVAAQFSRDGTYIVTGSLDGTARVWSATSGEPIGTPIRFASEVLCASFSPDGTRVAVGGRNLLDDKLAPFAGIWSVATGEPLSKPMVHKDDVISVCFSPDGSRLLTGSRDKTARVWDATMGTPVTHPLKQDSWDVYPLGFSPDGTRVVTGSRHTARIYDASTGKQIGKSMRHAGNITSVCFSPDGLLVLTASKDQTAVEWDAVTGEPIGKAMNHGASINSAHYSPDGTRIFTESNDGPIRIWNAVKPALTGVHMSLEGGRRYTRFSPDGTHVLTAYNEQSAGVFRAHDGQLIGQPLRHADKILSASFSPDGMRVITGSSDDTARIWDTKTGEPISDPIHHAEDVESVCFSPNGTWVLTGSADHTARIWDASTGAPICDPMEHESYVSSVCFSPNGKRLLTGCFGHVARVWEASSQATIVTSLRHAGVVNTVCFSPDGTRVLTASDHTSQLWDARTGRPIARPMQHDRVGSICFSRDGTRILTSSYDGTARVWEANTGKRIGALLRHGGYVFSGCFSPDGSRIVTGGADHKVRLWDAATSRSLCEPFELDNNVLSVSFSPDGSQILAGSYNSARIWTIPVIDAESETVDLSIQVRTGIDTNNMTPLTLEGFERAHGLLQNAGGIVSAFPHGYTEESHRHWHLESLQMALTNENSFAAAFHLRGLTACVRLAKGLEKTAIESRLLRRAEQKLTEQINTQPTHIDDRFWEFDEVKALASVSDFASIFESRTNQVETR